MKVFILSMLASFLPPLYILNSFVESRQVNFGSAFHSPKWSLTGQDLGASMSSYNELVASREARRNMLIQDLIEKNAQELDKALEKEELAQWQRELAQKLLETVHLITTPAGFRHVIRVEDRNEGSKPRQVAVHPLFARVVQTSGIIRLYYLGNGGRLYETAVYTPGKAVDDDVVATAVDEYVLHRMHPVNIQSLIHELEDVV